MTLSDRILALGLLQRPEGATVPEIVEGLRAGPGYLPGKLEASLTLCGDTRCSIRYRGINKPFRRNRWPVWVAPGRQP